MKRILFIILFLVRILWVFAQECSPSFREVFDFDTGDIFMINSMYLTSASAFPHGSDSYLTEAYIITGKFENGDTLFFSRKGISRLIMIRRSLDPEHPVPPDTINGLINDTLQYIDFPGHFLNQCEGDRVRMADLTIKDWYAFGNDSLLDAAYFTSVHIEQNDHMLTKTAGGENNFYPADSAGSIIDTAQWLPWADDYRPYLNGPLKFEVVHARGLGLTKSYWSNPEYTSDYQLVQYHKAGDSAVLPIAEIINGNSVKICQGEKVVLRAAHNSSYTYQWIKNGGIVIPGATSDTLAVSDSGSYRVFVTGSKYLLNFSDACIVEIHQLTVLQENSDTTIVSGTSLTLSPTIRYVGDNPLIFSWQPDPTLNETNIRNPVALPDTTRIYKFSVTDGVCEDTASYKVNVIDVVTGINGAAMPAIHIYPNPAREKVFIENLNASGVRIVIFDLYGRQLFNKEINSGVLDISAFEKGIYTLKLFDAGRVTTCKLIKEY